MKKTNSSWNASADVGIMDVFLSRPASKRWIFSRAARMLWRMVNQLERLGLYLEPREVHANERLLEIPFVLQRLPKSGRILDVGCAGNTLALQLACLGYQVTAVDVREYRFTHPNLTFLKEDISRASIRPNSHDGAILISTLEHMGLGHYGDATGMTDREFLDCVARFVKQGGAIWMTVPFGRAFEGDWYRVYDSKSLAGLIRGFTPVEKEFARRLSPFEWQLCREEDLKEVPSESLPINGVALLQIRKGRPT